MTAAEPRPTLKPLPQQLPTEQRLKIALLGYRSHPHVGGQGIYLRFLSRALAELGHTVHVYSGPPYPELDAAVELIKVPSLDLYAQENHVRALRWRHLKSFTDTWEWWTMLSGGFGEPYTFGRRVKKLLRHSDYDLIHDNQSLCYALLDLQKAGKKVVATIHHPIHQDRHFALQAAATKGDKWLVRRWYSFLSMQEKVVRKLDHVITVSATSQKDIAQHFQRSPERTPVIVNGIDCQAFRPLPEIAREKFRIISTASSDQPLKGLKYLLQALAEVRKHFPQVRLQLIGKLKTGGGTAALLNELQLLDCVEFISGLSTEELNACYARASVAVVPSLYEGFCLPAGEAMACELPLVATSGGAIPEVVGDAGILVAAQDSRVLAQAIMWAFNHPMQAQALGKRARQRIIEHFSWQKVAADLTQYYLSLPSQSASEHRR